MKLARPIANRGDPYETMIDRDREVPQDVIPHLLEQGISEVWVRYPTLEFLESVFDEESVQHHREIFRAVRKNLECILCEASLEMHVERFRTHLSDLFQYMKQCPRGVQLLEQLDSYDNYLVAHSTNVAYLGVLLGIRLARYVRQQRHETALDDRGWLQLLGLGCLLHDVGKMRVPPEILNKPSQLTDHEMQLIRMHPVYGFEMVRGSVPPAVAEVVLYHHRRWDGSGYPEHANPRTGDSMELHVGESIPVFARIATVADVYDAATSRRCYSGPKPPAQVLYEMRTTCRNFFDPVVERAFYKMIPPFPVGQRVALNDGHEAVVVDFSPEHPWHPRVQLITDPRGETISDPTRHELDLAQMPGITVASVGGIDVSNYVPAEDSLLQPT